MSSGATNQLEGGRSGNYVLAVGDYGAILSYGTILFASGFESGGLDGRLEKRRRKEQNPPGAARGGAPL